MGLHAFVLMRLDVNSLKALLSCFNNLEMPGNTVCSVFWTVAVLALSAPSSAQVGPVDPSG